MSDYNPSTCDVTEALIVSHDGSKQAQISEFVIAFEISQSMNRTSYNGSLTVFETVGLLESFPLRGEETLFITFRSNDIPTTVRLRTHIHKIDSITPSDSNNGIMYTIHFVSAITFNASKRVITKSYSNRVDKIAEEIFRTYFTKLKAEQTKNEKDQSLVYDTRYHTIIEEDTRGFYAQKAGNTAKVVIPRYTPTQAMHFICSQAYGREGSSHFFRFFETLENFYFVTDDFLIKQAVNSKDIPNFFYMPLSSGESDKPNAQLNRIDSLTINSKGANSGADISLGSYKNKVMELDLVRRKVDLYSFDYTKDAKYIDMSGNVRDLNDVPYTDAFMNDTFTNENARRFLKLKDYQDQGDNPSVSVATYKFIPEIISNRVSYYHHLSNTQVSASLKGRLDLRPGMIISIDIDNLDGVSGAKQNNVSLSGNYLIQSTTHSRSMEGILNTSLELVKFDWSKG